MNNPDQVLEERPEGRLRVRTLNVMESKTVQSDRDRADIKKILSRYEQTGVLVNMAQVDLAYRDASQFEDFSDLMQQSKAAEAAFLRLPSKVREVFHHDAAEWLDAAHDPEKLDAVAPKLRELGVLEQIDPTPPAAPAADPPPEA